MKLKCMYCDSELERNRKGVGPMPGARYDCPKRSCPVIFARVLASGEIIWVLEARPRKGVIAR